MAETEYCWINGKIVKYENATVHFTAKTYLSVFEGMRAYPSIKGGGLNVFRANDHLDRLFSSARVYRIEVGYSREAILQAIRDTVRANNLVCPAYVHVRIWPEDEGSSMAITAGSAPSVVGTDDFAKPRRYKIVSWRRISSDALPPQAKCFANYANSELGTIEAQEAGFDGPIFLDQRGFISESATSTLMSVKKGRLVTPPLHASILESVTRDSILTISPDLDIPIEVRDITRVELYSMDELFCCGTWSEIRPVTNVDGIEISDGKVGLVTRGLAEYYVDVAKGKVTKYASWLTSIA